MLRTRILDGYIPPQTTLQAELQSIHVHIGLWRAQNSFIYFQSKFFLYIIKSFRVPS